MRALLLAVLAPLSLLAWLAGAAPAQAAVCTASTTDLAFGTVDTLAGYQDVTATLTIGCTNIEAVGVRVCPYLGAGSGGRDAGARYMQGPDGALAYQIYRDEARTMVWGSATLGFGTYPTIDFPGNGLATATGQTALTLYGRLFAGQGAAAPGTYLSSFTGLDVEVQYGPNALGLLQCTIVQTLGMTLTPTFAATATVPANCLIATSAVAFGSGGALGASISAVGSLSVECTGSTPYSIALDNGSGGSGPESRTMTNGTETIRYGLYKDAAHTQPWGAASGEAVTGIGTGAVADLTVYGLVPPQATPSPGLYTDTVVVTVTY